MFLTYIAINALYIIGLYYATYYELDEKGEPTETMLLWRFRYMVEKYKKLPTWIAKPLILCPYCMASLHSTYIYFFINPFTLTNCLWFPVYVAAVSGLVRVLTKFTE